jgi:hypothetical protein
MITHEVPHKAHNTKEATNNTEILKRSLLFAAGAALLLGTLSTPVMSSSAHGAKYVQEGGTWTVCLCQVNNTNCQPCQ